MSGAPNAPVLLNTDGVRIYADTEPTAQRGTFISAYFFPINEDIESTTISEGYDRAAQLGMGTQCLLPRSELSAAVGDFADALYDLNEVTLRALEERPRSRQILDPNVLDNSINTTSRDGRTLRGLFGIGVEFEPVLRSGRGIVPGGVQQMSLAGRSLIDNARERAIAGLGNRWEVAGDVLDSQLTKILSYIAEADPTNAALDTYVIFRGLTFRYYTFTDLWLGGRGLAPHTISNLPYLLGEYAILNRLTRENCLWVSVAIACALRTHSPTAKQRRLVDDVKAGLRAGENLKRVVPPPKGLAIADCSKAQLRDLLLRLAQRKKVCIVVLDASFAILAAFNEDCPHTVRIMLHEMHYMAVVDRSVLSVRQQELLELESPHLISRDASALDRMLAGMPTLAEKPLPKYESPETVLAAGESLLPFEFRENSACCDKAVVGAPMERKIGKPEKRPVLLCTFDLETLARGVDNMPRIWESDVLAVPQPQVKLASCSRTIKSTGNDKELVVQDPYAVGMAAVEIRKTETDEVLGFPLEDATVACDPEAYASLIPFLGGQVTKIAYSSWVGVKDDPAEGCIAAWLSWLADQHEELAGTDIFFYAHNGGAFDAQFILRCIVVEADLVGWNLMFEECMELNGKWIKLVLQHWQYPKYRIVFLDSLCLLPGSLEKLAQSFGVSHQKDDFDHGSVRLDNYRSLWKTTNLQHYLKCDCIGLLEILLRFAHAVARNHEIPLWRCLTAASLAKRIFLQCFYSERFNLYYGSPEISHLLRQGYFGGRVEVFRRGLLQPAGGLSYYDMTSMYPTAMRFNALPTGRPRFTYKVCEAGTDRLHPDFFGFVMCTVKHRPDVVAAYDAHTERQWLPLHAHVHNKSLVVPLLKRGHDMLLFSEEVRYAQEKDLGYEYEFRWGIAFDKSTGVFDSYIDTIFQAKAEAKKNGDEAGKVLAKLLLNSIYGCFGLRTEARDSILLTKPGSLKWQNFASAGRLQAVAFHKKATALRVFKDIDSHTVQVAISSAVTAYSRVALHRFMMDVQRELGGKLVYCDTDSCVWENGHTHPLDSKSFFDAHIGPTYGGELGTWKSEYVDEAPASASKDEKLRGSFVRGTFVAPKVYCLEVDEHAALMKAKGFSQKHGKLTPQQYKNTIAQSDKLRGLLGKRKAGELSDDAVWSEVAGKYIAQRTWTMGTAKASYVSPSMSAFNVTMQTDILKILAGEYTKRVVPAGGSGWCAPLRL
tara:strand:+ start:1869 stop:5537 length:3669 start_codon:yes stop_codon:yes gene_type:complete